MDAYNKFSQSVFLSDFNFIVVNYVAPVAKFNIICERCMSTKLSKPSLVTPLYFLLF